MIGCGCSRMFLDTCPKVPLKCHFIQKVFLDLTSELYWHLSSMTLITDYLMFGLSVYILAPLLEGRILVTLNISLMCEHFNDKYNSDKLNSG